MKKQNACFSKLFPFSWLLVQQVQMLKKVRLNLMEKVQYHLFHPLIYLEELTFYIRISLIFLSKIMKLRLRSDIRAFVLAVLRDRWEHVINFKVVVHHQIDDDLSFLKLNFVALDIFSRGTYIQSENLQLIVPSDV